MMKRDCPICNVEPEKVWRQVWDLPGLATHDIGFSICPECGLVFQSPTVKPEDMQKYYSETAVYINPGRNGKPPSYNKKRVAWSIKALQSVVGDIPQSVFQVGCSDGFTLSEFRGAGASEVSGIDPGSAGNTLAKELYGIEITTGTIEQFQPSRHYDLMILTHILEHLYDPLKVMAKCALMQDEGGWLLLEVPLLERLDRLPPGYFTLEHLNYFSEPTLLRMLGDAGYVAHMIEKRYCDRIYPCISVVARKERSAFPSDADSDYSRARPFIQAYRQRETGQWQNISDKLKQRMRQGASVYIWGAGIHTSQLLASTDLRSYVSIKGLLDSSPTKWGKRFGDLTCLAPHDVQLGPDDTVVISSYVSEGEIYRNLKASEASGFSVQTLHQDYTS
jgi:hypothetical protein